MTVDIEGYAASSAHIERYEIPELLQNAVRQLPMGGRLLDIGAGDGTILRSLRRNGLISGASSTIGVDLSFLRLSRGLLNSGHVKPVQANGQALPLVANSIDVALACMVIEHVENDVQIVREIVGVLNTSG